MLGYNVDCVGFMVGCNVCSVGGAVGDGVGFMVGITVGFSVGNNVGCMVRRT